MASLVCIVFKSSSCTLRTLHIETRYSLATGCTVSNPCYRLFVPRYTRYDIQSNLYDPWHWCHDSLQVHTCMCICYLSTYVFSIYSFTNASRSMSKHQEIETVNKYSWNFQHYRLHP